MKLSKCHFFTKEVHYLGHTLSTKGIRSLPSKMQAIKNMHSPKMPKQVHAFLGHVGYYKKFIRNFAKIVKPLTLLTHQQAKFEWTTTHHNAFLTLEESVIQAPILHYPNPPKTLHSIYRCIRWCLWSTVVSGTWWNRIPNSFSFTYLHRHTTEIEHYRTRGLWCILCSHEMELLPAGSWNHSMQWPQTTEKKNANNKVNRWGLELATYNITFKWISGAHNKAADYLSQLVELPQDRPATVNMLSVTSLDGPAFNTRSRTAQCTSTEDATSQPQLDAVTPDVTDTTSTTPKSLTMGRLQALLHMQKTDPFCKQISKWL